MGAPIKDTAKTESGLERKNQKPVTLHTTGNVIRPLKREGKKKNWGEKRKTKI